MHTMINILNATCPKTAFLLFIFISTIWFHEKLDQNNYIIIEFGLRNLNKNTYKMFLVITICILLY